MGTTFERDGDKVSTQLLPDNYRVGLVGEPGADLSVTVSLTTTTGCDSVDFVAGAALTEEQVASLSALLATLRAYALNTKGYTEKV